MNDELVVGVDVGSQGTCAQAIAADGTHVFTSYVPHSLSFPQPGWAEQDPAEWLGAVARALDEVRRSVDGRPLRAVSFGSQLDGLVATTAGGSATGAALIWMDRRATAECKQAADELDPARLRELTGCNLDPGHVAAKISWLRRHRSGEHDAARWFLLPGSFVAWQAAGELAVDPSNASSSMLLDIGTRELVGGGLRRLRRGPGNARPYPARPFTCSDRWRRGCAAPPVWTAPRWWCSAAATRWPPPWERE